MVNIVLACHGDMGNGLIRAAEMIAGPAERVFSVPLLPGESPESYGEKLSTTLSELKGEQTLILIDLLGGTPCNVAAREVVKANVAGVTGVNLPMLLELLMARAGASLEELAQMATKAGQDSVIDLGFMLRQ
jgi:mannose/fructose/sorbose-specific phosphotransferase system IIA component